MLDKNHRWHDSSNVSEFAKKRPVYSELKRFVYYMYTCTLDKNRDFLPIYRFILIFQLLQDEATVTIELPLRYAVYRIEP